MDIEEQLAAKFNCPKCKHSGGKADSIAATGTGFSKFLDIQNRRFITISCTHCGYTEMYNKNMLEGKSGISDIFDFIFGG